MILYPFFNLESLSVYLCRISLTNCPVAPLSVHSAVAMEISKALLTNQQSEVKLMLLTARLIGFPTPYIADRAPPPKWSTRLRQSPARQEHPKVVRFGN